MLTKKEVRRQLNTLNVGSLLQIAEKKCIFSQYPAKDGFTYSGIYPDKHQGILVNFARRHGIEIFNLISQVIEALNYNEFQEKGMNTNLSRFTMMLALIALIQPAQAVDRGDILDFIPGIIAASQYEPPPPPPPPVMPAGVTVLKTTSNLNDYSGDLLIVGEVYNNTSSPIEFTKVVANIYNNGKFVATDYTYVNRDILMPKTKSCFKMYTDYGGAYTGVSFQPVTYRNTSKRVTNLSITGVSKTVDYSGDLKLIGMIKNTTSKTIDFTSVIGTFYNSSKKVIDCDFTYASNDSLSPNQSSSFVMWTSTNANSVTSYQLQSDYND